MEIKRSAFSGSWYPSGAAECERQIQGFLGENNGPLTGSFAGGIVPHAGWYYSGSIACNVIASLSTEDLDPKHQDPAHQDPAHQAPVDTIVLFGAHMHKQSEPFIMTHGAVDTPFGPIEIDEALTSAILSGVSLRPRSPDRFPDENTLELQYPFIKYFFPKAQLVTCGVAPSSFAPLIGSMVVMEARKLGKKIKIIGSTDMTHYGRDFGFTPQGTGKHAVDWVKTVNDRNAMDAMIRMDDASLIRQGLDEKNMCCAGAVAATASACKTLGVETGIEYAYSTSFDKSGAADSFVGYAGILYPLAK
ncbi:MAG: AmmeMemoRadiSam system protein B [Desulfobacteraceae bacterium]|nr:MAG: AmmeMemoRadiSam system protein B [Desulfobacteraceae bacterium]